MTSSTATFLTTLFLGAVRNLTSVFGSCGTLTLVSEILKNIEVDSVIIRCNAENFLVEDNLLSGLRSVNLQN